MCSITLEIQMKHKFYNIFVFLGKGKLSRKYIIHTQSISIHYTLYVLRYINFRYRYTLLRLLHILPHIYVFGWIKLYAFWVPHEFIFYWGNAISHFVSVYSILCYSIDSLFTLIHFIIINMEYNEGVSRFCSNKDFLCELCICVCVLY